MQQTNQNVRAMALRELAALIATKSNASAEIAQGFGLIADAMEPCIDCGRDDAQDAGTDQGMGGTD